MQKIGTINGFVKSIAWFNGKSFEFDGTTRGLTLSALANGAKEGTKIKANFGGKSIEGAREMVIVSAPHDERAKGFWAI